MKRRARAFVLCIRNHSYPVSLTVRRVYERLSDDRSAKLGMIRVIDETGEDYLFPARLFVPIELPEEARRLFRQP